MTDLRVVKKYVCAAKSLYMYLYIHFDSRYKDILLILNFVGICDLEPAVHRPQRFEPRQEERCGRNGSGL